jgi:DNA-binding MarR family transcriptional regulator
MSETRLLALVMRYPHPRALARYVGDPSVLAAVRRLEQRGFVRRQSGHFRLTYRGRSELALAHAVAWLVVRTAFPRCSASQAPL